MTHAKEASGGEANDGKEAPAEDTSTAADGGVDKEKKEESIVESLSTKQADGQSAGNELNENDKAANAQVVADGSEESEQAVERSVVEPTEATVKAVDLGTSITHKEGDDVDDGDRENPQSKDAVLENESDPHETDDDSTTNNDEKLKEDTLPNTDNLKPHKSTAVSMEKDTDAQVSDCKENVSLNEEDKVVSVEDEDESETSEDEQDSQNANIVSRLENETNVMQEQGAAEEQEENVLQKGDSMEVDSLPAYDEEKDDIVVDNPACLMTSPTDLDKENEHNVQFIEDPAETEPSQSSVNEEDEKDDSEIENSTKPEDRSSAEEPLPVETGSTHENASTPPPSAAIEEPPNAVEMDAEPDDEEEELLKTSAALAGKSEDAEEIDIEEAEEEEAALQPDQDDAAEDGISSKLVDTDDPMLAEQEQEE
uniref:Uncharacterized protein n=1 Tax=Anopheles atroparvus TaxID=41427 RepID=A0A182JFY0_ANOAO